MPHTSKSSAASKKPHDSFKVIILKTDAVLPHTPVFFESDCGYRNGEPEKALREAVGGG